MLLTEKIYETHFSYNERDVIKFIEEEKEKIENYSTTYIADKTDTTPSTLVRIAKKLGYSGWNDFKKDYLKEIRYLNSHFNNIDANTPFDENDSFINIAHKIGQLHQESVEDTLSLINPDTLQKAVNILLKSKRIHVMAITNLCYAAEELVFKFRRIGVDARTYTDGHLLPEALMIPKDDCCIFVSYSGQTEPLLDAAEVLHNNGVPMIALTSIGENDLSHLANASLYVSTREKSYKKIGAYTSLESIHLLMDILYSCFFQVHYDKNYEHKIKLAQLTESRQISNTILKDEE
ncbi:MurR/RpiR family transcriptional regulator [uncultured Catenibacterium sp.]|uniref:MurR/RpiR family transcriptional regulator n=1 Tax=uncultured Catenibacterium sp. TaxID=286142 RepID=UPI0025E1D6C0|nr:MurR/RpiR family transcriptional regulator [uncultured Catenibacterium sp.]